MKENIDKYYLVLIKRITNISHSRNMDIILTKCKESNFKYAIVSKIDYEFEVKYEDLISKEIYRVGIDYYHTELGDLIMDPKFDMIPLNQILDLRKPTIRRSELLKISRNYIIELNKEYLNIEQKNIIDILNSNDKSKKLKLSNSIIRYKEEE